MDTKNVTELINQLKGINATTPIIAIIPSYCGEWINTHAQDFYDESKGIHYFIYTDYNQFISDTTESLRTLDLTAGADDQFYDYNLSCFESLIYAAQQALPLNKAIIYQGLLQLIKDLETWAQDPDNDDDGMLETYKSEQANNIEGDSLEGLEGYEFYKLIKQSL